MQQLNNLGVGLTLDDFGIGYSSLNYLRKFPFHRIKIDQSFICDLGDARDVRAIIGAVASLDKTVVAEGIETEERIKLVTSLPRKPGLFIRPPDPREAIRARLETPITLVQMVA
jgi:EAL domain-containing protein (putative c-di-GMP-specific phosphodiesterase class I)